MECRDLNRLPGALAKDLVEVKRDGLLLNKALHLSFHRGRKDPHQSLGSKPEISFVEYVLSLKDVITYTWHASCGHPVACLRT